MKQYINEAKRLQQLAGIKEVEENEESIKNQILSLRKEYYALIVKMYGPDGIELRKAGEYVKRLMPGEKDSTPTPEENKIKIEEKELQQKIRDIGVKINKLYEQLENMGLGELVKKMKEEYSKILQKAIPELTDQAIEKAKSDARNNIKKMEADVEKKHQTVVDFNNSMADLKAKIIKYGTDYKNWLKGDQQTPPPFPPTLPPSFNGFFKGGLFSQTPPPPPPPPPPKP